MDISREEFDQYVIQAIDSIAPQFRGYLNEVPVIVDDLPDKSILERLPHHDARLVLGIFQGVPLALHQAGRSVTNRIILFRRNILACCRTRPQLIKQINKTIIHELGHYLGFNEEQLRRLQK